MKKYVAIILLAMAIMFAFGAQYGARYTRYHAVFMGYGHGDESGIEYQIGYGDDDHGYTVENYWEEYGE